MKQAHPDCPRCQCFIAEEGEHLTVTVNGIPFPGELILSEDDVVIVNFVKHYALKGNRE